MKNIKLTFFYLYLLVCHPSSSQQFNGLYYPKLGVYIDPEGYSAHPYGVKLLTVNIAFDNPFVGESQLLDKCKNGGYITDEDIKMVTSIMESLMNDIKDLLDPTYNKYTAQFCNTIEHLCDRDLDGIPDHEDKHLGVFGNEGYNKSKINYRVKRGGPLLLVAALGAGLFLLGSQIYNWVSMKQLADRISEIERNQEKIMGAIRSMYGVTHAFTKAEDDMFHALRNIIPELVNEEKRTDCNVFRLKLDQYISYAYRTREAIVRVVNQAMSGSVTTEMITASELASVVLHLEDFSGSVYKEDLDLFYRLSMALPVAYNPFQHVLTVVIAVPLISNGDISPLLRVHNFGWAKEGRLYRLNTPEEVAVISEERVEKSVSSGKSAIVLKQAIPVNRSYCVNKGTIHLCTGKDLQLSGSTSCATALIKGDEEAIKKSCSIQAQLKTEDSLKAIQILRGGVFFRGYPFYSKQIIMSRGISQPTEEMVPVDNNTLVPYSEFDYLIVNGRSISSKQSLNLIHITAHHDFNTSGYDSVGIDHILDDENWVNLDKDMRVLREKEKEMEKYANFGDHRMNVDKSISIVILILVVAIIVALSILWRKYKMYKTTSKTFQENLLGSVGTNRRALLALTEEPEGRRNRRY